MASFEPDASVRDEKLSGDVARTDAHLGVFDDLSTDKVGEWSAINEDAA